MIYTASLIDVDSWLMEDRFYEFRARYAYAASQNQAIPGLAKMSPEECYHVWAALERAPVSNRDSGEGSAT